MGLRATPALGCEELDGVHGPLHLVDAQDWPRSVLSGQSTEKLRDDKCNLKRWHSKKKSPSTETLQGRHDLQPPPLGGAVSLLVRAERAIAPNGGNAGVALSRNTQSTRTVRAERAARVDSENLW